MNVSNVDQAIQQAATSQRAAASSSSGDGKQLGKQDFLNLLMTQMSHQDPMNPMDTENMMQQMSSLSTVEQLQNLNAQVGDLMKLQRQSAWAGASSLVGQDVEIGTRSLALQNGQATPLSYNLEGDADQVVVHVMDGNGELVRRVNLEARAQGSHQFTWDGLDAEGDPMPDGNYRFDIVARTDSGEGINVKMSKSGQVSMIKLDDTNPLIQINGEWLPANSILGVSNRSSKRFDALQPLPLREDLQPKSLNSMPGTLRLDEEQH